MSATCLMCGKRLSFLCDTKWQATPVPPCPECGGNRYVAREQTFNRDLARNEDGGKVFRCSHCEPDEPVPKGWKERTIVSRERYRDRPGPYGDGCFCSLNCGYRFGVASARAGYRLKKEGE